MPNANNYSVITVGGRGNVSRVMRGSTQVWSIHDAELITNTDFLTNSSPWYAPNGAIAWEAAGRVRVSSTSSTTSGRMVFNAPTVPGMWYRVAMTASVGSGEPGLVVNNTEAPQGAVINFRFPGGTVTRVFQATAATTRIMCWAPSGDGQYAFLNYCSLIEM